MNVGFEEILGAVVEAKLAPVRQDLQRLVAELAAMRKALPAALVTVDQAAEYLGISISTVRRRLRDGSLPFKRVGRAVRIDLSALHATAEAEIVEMARVARAG